MSTKTYNISETVLDQVSLNSVFKVHSKLSE